MPSSLAPYFFVVLTVLGFAESAFGQSCRDVFALLPKPHLNRDFQIESVQFHPIITGHAGEKLSLPDQVTVAQKSIGRVSTDFIEVRRPIPHVPSIWEDDGFIGTGYYMKMMAYYSFKLRLWNAFESLHNVYKGTLSPADHEVTVSKDADEIKMLYENQRASYFIANLTLPDGKSATAAVARIHDGRMRSTDTMAPELPIEKRFSQRKTKTAVFDKLRAEGHDLLEIGKYFLRDDLAPTEKKVLRLEMFKWLESNFLVPGKLSEETVFVIDPVSSLHERTYQTFYGARVIDRNEFVPPLSSDESVMLVSLPELRSRIRHLIEREERSGLLREKH